MLQVILKIQNSNMKVGINNIIQIQNPTNTKHKLVLDSQGKEVGTSDDITPGP